ncbi:SARP family transcriptional regulator [Rhizocola hellebori]|uniref:SARP family transcriptional regulator n=1 Tax=Rhizocola hellebori TaxID=1392758 RepID=A0A8J3QF77_9ACTN|nr:BTAD domain-containing putative transcriptional regulator [Rhizocola hellebori]GIH08497.1 SARP family transcriptional regulator [Rhizocola hellebori]
MNPRIQLLGPVRGWLGDAELDLGSPRQKGLLALLALAAGQPLSRSYLTESLWGDEPPASHANVIQVYVTRLRRAFEPHRPARHPGQVLTAIGDGYALRIDPGAVDALRFRRGLSQAATARRAGDHTRVRSLLTPVLAEWASPLQDAAFFSDQRTFASLVDDRWTAIAWHAAATIETGDAAQVLAPLKEAAAARPWDEAIQALLIRALHAVGRRGDAINTYRRIQQSLRDDLGVEPGQELVEAFGLVLSDATAEPEVREPVVVAQLLPRTGHFTGRRTELSSLRSLLEGQHTRAQIVCVEGGPGVGKTSLALELAHSLAPRFGDGQLFIDLRGHDPAASVGCAEALVYLLRSLGTDESRLPEDQNELAARYRTAVAGRSLLVVLDNAASTEQILPLLPATPSCAVIVTSRYSLTALSTHQAANRHHLGMLSIDDSISLVALVIGAQRIAAEPEAADVLARLCGGLPLALRITAAKLLADPDRKLESMATELAREQQRLGGLSVEDGGRSVRGAFQWSYRALSTPEARAFRLLSLHPGTTFATDLVAALTHHTAKATTTLLARLASAHLIDAVDVGRYRVHDLLRLFAGELLESQETADQRDAARHRLLHWYLDVADGCNRLVTPLNNLVTRPTKSEPLPFAAGQKAALAYLSGEADNLPLVVRDASRHGFDLESWQLAYLLFSFYLSCTRPADFLACANWGLGAARRTGDRRAEGIMLNIAGIAANIAHRMQDSIDLHQQQLAIWQELGEPAREAAAWTNLGTTKGWMNRHKESLAAYQHALELYTAACDTVRSGYTLDNIGNKARDLGDLALSQDSLLRALAIWREAGYPQGEGQALYELGKTKFAAGDRAAALELLNQALGLQRDIGDDRMAALSLHWIGKIHTRTGDLTKAAGHLEQALELFRGMHDEHGESAVLTTLAAGLTAQNDHSGAHQLLKQAWTLRKRLPDPLEEGLLHDAISTLASHMGDTQRAETHRATANTKFAEADCAEARQMMGANTKDHIAQ